MTDWSKGQKIDKPLDGPIIRFLIATLNYRSRVPIVFLPFDVPAIQWAQGAPLWGKPYPKPGALQ